MFDGRCEALNCSESYFEISRSTKTERERSTTYLPRHHRLVTWIWAFGGVDESAPWSEGWKSFCLNERALKEREWKCL
jgi:hypothetical protein